MPKASKPPVTKTLVTRMFGHVPFRTIIAANEKGGYIASTKYNGQEFVGHGDSVRKATIDVQQQLDDAVSTYKVRTQ